MSEPISNERINKTWGNVHHHGCADASTDEVEAIIERLRAAEADRDDLKRKHDAISQAARHNSDVAGDAIEEIRKLKAERDDLLASFKASETWRKAYQKGKGKLYAMGGVIAEAAMSCLPCSEGALDQRHMKYIETPYVDSIKRERDAATKRAEVAENVANHLLCLINVSSPEARDWQMDGLKKQARERIDQQRKAERQQG